MTTSRTMCRCALLLPLLAGGLVAEGPAEEVLRRLRPSLARVQNMEVDAAGIVLDETGLVATASAAAVTPQPLVVTVGGATYKRVTVIGVHPALDVCVLRVDPTENKGKLIAARLAETAVSPGQRVWVLSNPGWVNLNGPTRIGEALVSGVGRAIGGGQFLQFSANVPPVDSGAPLCDEKGRVVGLISFQPSDVEGIAFASPVHGFQAAQVVRLEDRPKDAAAAIEICKTAEKYYQEATDHARKHGLQSEQAVQARLVAALLWRMAMVLDPCNSLINYNLGMVWRTLDLDELASGYLARSIRIEPWAKGADAWKAYRELGFALSKQGKLQEARRTWEEGLAKYPKEGALIWEDLSILYLQKGSENLPESVYCALVAASLGSPRAGVMKQNAAALRGRLSAAELKTLSDREAGMTARLKEMQSDADYTKSTGEPFVTRSFEELLGTFQGLQKHDPNAGAGLAGGGRAGENASPEDVAKNKDAEIAAWIRGKVSLAENFLRIGSKEKAIEILEEVLRTHPEHPGTKAARELLEKNTKK